MGTTVQKPDPSQASSPEQFLEALRRLRTWAGRPSYRRLKDLAGPRINRRGHKLESLPTTTTWEILSGKRLPNLPRMDFVEAFVTACMLARRAGTADVEAEVESWRQAWHRLAGPDDARTIGAETATPGRPEQPEEAWPVRVGHDAPARATEPMTAEFPLAVRPTMPDAGPTGPMHQTAPLSRGVRITTIVLRWKAAVFALLLLVAGSAGVVLADQALDRPGDPGPADTVERTVPGEELVPNGKFVQVTDPWWEHGGVNLVSEDGVMRIEVAKGGVVPWDNMVGLSGIELVEGQKYLLTFDASASTDVDIRVTVQQEHEPYDLSLNENVELDRTMHSFQFDVIGKTTRSDGQVTFQLGGHPRDFVVEIDNVSFIELDTVVVPAGS